MAKRVIDSTIPPAPFQLHEHAKLDRDPRDVPGKTDWEISGEMSGKQSHLIHFTQDRASLLFSPRNCLGFGILTFFVIDMFESPPPSTPHPPPIPRGTRVFSPASTLCRELQVGRATQLHKLWIWFMSSILILLIPLGEPTLVFTHVLRGGGGSVPNSTPISRSPFSGSRLIT